MYKKEEDSMIVGDGKAFKIFQKYIIDKKVVVLDVGSGSGTFLKSLDMAGYKDFFACDLENNLTEMKISQERMLSTDLSFDKFPLEKNYFDAITAWEMIEHLENPHNFIREAHRVLKPGGYFIVSMPNPFHLISKLNFLKHGNMPRWTRRNNHITFFTKDLFWKAVLKNYFDLVSTEFYLGEFTYGPFKYFDGRYPENELFGHFIIYIMRKKVK